MKVQILFGTDVGVEIEGFEVEDLKKIEKFIKFLIELLKLNEDLIIKGVVMHDLDKDDYVG